MTIFNVHIYREMRLRFDGIEADTPEAAAGKAKDLLLEDADDFDECDGETYAALVDVQGDEEFSQSVTIDFEAERHRKAAAKLLDVLRWITRCAKIRGPIGTTAYIVSDERMAQARTAIAEAEDAGIASAPAAPALPAVLIPAAGRTIRIEVRGGVVQEVSNVPPGWDYEIVDHDDPDDPRLIRKQLTSNAMFHTPGFFRALQNDYRIKGLPRRRAIKLLSEGYGLPLEEAEGLLSGAIEIEIDEAAGTVAYACAADR